MNSPAEASMKDALANSTYEDMTNNDVCTESTKQSEQPLKISEKIQPVWLWT